MKKNTLSFLLISIVIIGGSAFINKKSSTGIQGYTGSPGEGTCAGSSCHSGGSSASSGITITAVPAFSVNINADTEYMPDSTYQISITVSANGFTKYGFACEILNPSVTNAGTLQTQGSGVKFLTAGSKKTATHTTAKTGNPAIFTFKWKAPSSGDATIYAIANAVNGNGQRTGDFVIAPVSLNLIAAPVPVDTHTDVSVKEISTSPLSHVSLFPNPTTNVVTMSYDLKESSRIHIELVNINGSVVKQLYDHIDEPGNYSQILDLKDIPSGVFFVKTKANEKMVAQKLIVIP